MIKHFITIVLCILNLVVFAQKIPNYDWQTSRKQFKLSDLEPITHEIRISERKISEVEAAIKEGIKRLIK